MMEMRFSWSILATAVLFGSASGLGFADESRVLKRVSTEAVRISSARLYSDILSHACLNGRRYSRSAIKMGFERHFREMKLTFIDHGYTVVPDVKQIASVAPPSTMAFDADRRRGLPRQFGCFRAYWLELES